MPEIIGYYTTNGCFAGDPKKCDPSITKYILDGGIAINPDDYSYLPDDSVLNCQTNDPATKMLFQRLKKTEFLSEITSLARRPGGFDCLRLVLRQGTFMQFYYAAYYLADVPRYENLFNIPSYSLRVKITIERMINSSEAWEKALGLVLLGSRAHVGKPSDVNTVYPFLKSSDPLLQLAAAISLLRMSSPEVMGPESSHHNSLTPLGVRAGEALVRFAQENPNTPVGQMLVYFLSFEEQSMSASLIKRSLYGWPEMRNNQTSFFRYANIANELIAVANKAQPDDTYRVWDIGCSTGITTESYRVALSLSNRTNDNTQIMGTDISPLALIYAARGSYLLEEHAHADHYTYFPLQSELSRYRYFYPGADTTHEQVLARIFKQVPGILGSQYVARRGPNAVFAFDDITSPNSVVPDKTVDAAIYTYVHYLLPRDTRMQAIHKIYDKLKPGGLVFVVDDGGFTYMEFETVFGTPVKTLMSPINDDVVVYRKGK